MATVTYLTSATNETYSAGAFGYISTRQVIDSITETANILGTSAGAIAGAMVEENTAYGFTDEALDIYAKSSIDPAIAALTLAPAIYGGPVAFTAWLALNATQVATPRTQAEQLKGSASHSFWSSHATSPTH